MSLRWDGVVFYDINFFGPEPWWESKKPPKPIVAQRVLYDIRDSNFYVVRKLADGNCWMTENLRLVGPRTLTSSDTNIPSGSSFNLLAPISASSWCDSVASSCYDKSETVLFTNYENYGALYNWFTAIAGTGTSSTYTTNSSICPKQWKLLKSGSSGNMNALYLAYSSNGKNLLNAPAFLTMAGTIISGAPIYRDSIGTYWEDSGESGNLNYAYDTYIDHTGIFETSRDALKSAPNSVRCVAQ